MSLISKGIEAVYHKIDKACLRCGRDPASVRLCLATKTRTFDEVLEASRHVRNGCIIGENHVQTAVDRVAEGVHTHDFDKHFIGHLQSNKINQILPFADCIQTIDGIKLAGKIYAKLAEREKRLRIYIQVNSSREEQKSGCVPEDCVALVTEISQRYSDWITVEGLMTIGINSPEEAKVAACFALMARLKEEINSLSLPSVDIKELSMGMSGDMELAIEHGSTMVRVGTAIFGERDYSKGATTTAEGTTEGATTEKTA